MTGYCPICGPSPADLGDEPFIDDMEIDEDEELEDDELIDEDVTAYLDREASYRDEWDRIQYDLFPMGEDFEPSPAPRIHRDTDAIQQWMRDQRRENA